VTYDLRRVPLFSGLEDSDLERLSDGLAEHHLPSGEILFEEGDDADVAYVITGGEIEILKDSAGRRVRIAVSGVGDVVGEMALLTAEPRNATAKALTSVDLVSIPKACLDDVLSTSVRANRALFEVFISRWREQESRVRQSERMAQLGVLTAGLAHEMNNPAAAVSRGADSLRDVVARQLDLARRLPPDIAVPSPSAAGVALSTMERSGREEAIEEVLEALGVDRAWELSGPLVDGGFLPGDFTDVDPEFAGVLVAAAAADAECASLLAEVAEGAQRVSALVAALKSYSFLDQAPIQQVDVVKGIEDTLLILKSKTKDIEIEREYAPEIPSIVAYGSQLNQVWTNLIDNAADAIHDAGLEDGRIVIRARGTDDAVVVEIENNGPAIPAGIVDRIFEAFFTTKEPGRGTGLGLDTAYGIVVTQHRGTIEVASVDGSTVFTVSLPRDQETGMDDDGVAQGREGTT
jgi:signal transduction histidine kinase